MQVLKEGGGKSTLFSTLEMLRETVDNLVDGCVRAVDTVDTVEGVRGGTAGGGHAGVGGGGGAGGGGAGRVLIQR